MSVQSSLFQQDLAQSFGTKWHHCEHIILKEWEVTCPFGMQIFAKFRPPNLCSLGVAERSLYLIHCYLGCQMISHLVCYTCFLISLFSL